MSRKYKETKVAGLLSWIRALSWL